MIAEIQSYEVDYDLTRNQTNKTDTNIDKSKLIQLFNQLQNPDSSEALFLPHFYFSVIH